MSENEKADYSAYIAQHSNFLQLYAFFSGFVFTAITILLTLLPDPSQFLAQITLFALTFLFGLFSVLIHQTQVVLYYCARIAPVLPDRTKKSMNSLWHVTTLMLPATLVLMFLLWNLPYLALSTVIVDGFLIIVVCITEKPLLDMLRPEEEWRKRK